MSEKNIKELKTEDLQHKPGENKMGYMPMGKLLFDMSWPAIISMTINALYNVVDSMFVSRISEDALTAVGIITPLQMMIIAVSVGSGVGVNSLIARRLGASNQDDADQAASTGIFIGFINYLVFLLVGLFLPKVFVGAYAKQGTYIFDAAAQYLKIVMIGSVFINLEIQIEKIMQSTGNMRAPMICSMTGAVINVVFDPILIFGLLGAPKMGVSGAAIATVFGQFCSLILGIIMITRPGLLVKIKLKGFKVDWNIVKEIYRVGLPSIVMQSIVSVMNVFYNKILVTYSTTAVAVLSVYFKVQSFVFMPVFGLNQGAMPIIGFNFGAKKKDRIMSCYRNSLIFAFSFMFICFLAFQILPQALLGIFDASPEMLKLGVPALRIISINFLFAPLGIMNGTVFQGTGHGLYSLICSVIRQLVGIVPAAFILARIGGVTMSWFSFPIGEILGIVYSVIVFRKLYKNEIMTL